VQRIEVSDGESIRLFARGFRKGINLRKPFFQFRDFLGVYRREKFPLFQRRYRVPAVLKRR
jgi:hypothetical protein